MVHQTLCVSSISSGWCVMITDGSGHSVPVCEHSKGTVFLDDAPHHADLLRSKELQRQRLTWHQHHSRVWKHRDGLTAVVIVDRAAVKLLHV